MILKDILGAKSEELETHIKMMQTVFMGAMYYQDRALTTYLIKMVQYTS